MAEASPAETVMAEASPAETVMAAASPAETFVGIDLGILNGVVGFSTKDDPTAVTVATNDISNRATPAVVGFDGCLRLVGDSAEVKRTQLPKQIVTSVPAVLGTPETARANWERFGSLWGLTDSGKIGPMSFGGREDQEFQPASCLAPLLQRLVSFAAVGESGEKEAVAPKVFELAISVPDLWTEAELSTLRSAIGILKWPQERVHVLPYSGALATALAHKISQRLNDGEARRVVVIIDIGFSQSSVSVAAFTAPPEDAENRELGIEILANVASPSVCTQAFCTSLANHINQKQEQGGKEVFAHTSKRGVRLITALHKALKELSMGPDTTVALECFYADETDLKVDLSRGLFEEIVRAQLQEFADCVDRAISQAGVAFDDVNSLELVGGGMRIPRVQQLLSEKFPDADAAGEDTAKSLSKRLRFGLDSSSSIATGAAHYAAGRRALKSRWNFAEVSLSVTEAELIECQELEAWMARTSDSEEKRLEKGNELESYIYKVRSWLSGGDRKLLSPDLLEPLVDEALRWFEDAQYEESTTFEVYDGRLSALQQQVSEHGKEYFEKQELEKAVKEKQMEEEAEKERQRRKDAGMDDDKDDRKMTKTERLKLANNNKEEGNVVFKAGNLADAAGRYQRALQHLTKYFRLDCSPEEKAEADAVGLSVQLNLSQVYLKLAAQTEKESGKDKAEAVYMKAKASAEEALTIDPESAKARFRKATALEKLGDVDEASKLVKAALKLDPENADLLKFKERLDKLLKIQKDKAKKMCGKMFG